MQITRRIDLEALLLDEMRASFAREERTTDEIHVSDLLAPRRAYWGRVHPKPVTDDEIGYFVAGRAHEDAVGRVSGVQPGEPRQVDGIWLRSDFYTSIPLEFKTRRRSLAADADEATRRYDTYIDQCRAYAALQQRPAAWLWVLGLVSEQRDGGTKPEFQVWHLDFTPDELLAERVRLGQVRDLLRAAWDGAGVEGVPLCPDWQCGKVGAVMVQPPHCQSCDRTFQTEWGAKKHLDSKTGAGHTMTPATFTRTYAPKCRWYDECRPWLADEGRRGDPPPARPAPPEEMPF